MGNPLFENLAKITNKKQPYDEDVKYDPYIINRFISMNEFYIKFANEANRLSFSKLPKKQQFNFYLHSLPKRFVRFNYIGAKNKLAHMNKDDIEKFQIYFECSSKDAIERINCLPKKEIDKILKTFEYGVKGKGN